MYYWVCQKCDLKVWGAENCWCGINREQNERLAEVQAKNRKGIKTMGKHYVVVDEWAFDYGCEKGIDIIAVAHTLKEAKEIFAQQVIEDKKFAMENSFEVYIDTDVEFDAGESGYYTLNHTNLYIQEVGE